jgi:hypothetical protein
MIVVPRNCFEPGVQSATLEITAIIKSVKPKVSKSFGIENDRSSSDSTAESLIKRQQFL